MAFLYVQANKVVILTTGKHAGKKAVVLKVFEEGSGNRKYPYCLVVGLHKPPGKVFCSFRMA